MTFENIARAVVGWIVFYGTWHLFNRFVGTPMSKWMYRWTDEGADAYFIVLNVVMGLLLLALVLPPLFRG